MKKHKSLDVVERRVLLGRWYGKQMGYKGNKGGWILNANGRPVAQGWLDLYHACERRIWKMLNGEAA
jgi:hypothetical protein